MPCIGPLVPGHVMVVSKHHFINLATMDDSAITEYERLAAFIHTRSPYDDDGVFEVEHGAVKNKGAGGCIIHTHIHWIPQLGKMENIFESVLDQQRMNTTSLKKLHDLRQPYMFSRVDRSRLRFYHANDVPSQFLRRELCRALGREDWDWAVFKKMDWIAETVKIWRNYL